MEAETSRRDYDEMGVAAARSVMLELIRIFGAYREDIALVGGWVPSLVLPEPADRAECHCGSLDIDLALNHKGLSGSGYATIHGLLLEHGYEPDGEQPFQYCRKAGGITVRVDLLAGEYGGTGKKRRTQHVQDIRPRKARGCDLVFELGPVWVELRGELPDGAKDRVQVPVASALAFLAMKAFAMRDRLKRKDAYDIWYLLDRFPNGIDAFIETARPHLQRGLVREALAILAEKFETVDHVGPRHAAEFDEDLDEEFREQRQRAAFELVSHALEQLGITRV